MRKALRDVRRRSATPGQPTPPERPVGGKFELTYTCNLRCGFCYTDSPRRTLERASRLELTDDAWREVIADAIELGIVEAVVTGGEPLLRRELCLSTLERLDRAGVATCCVTNGWFVDEEIAERLSRLRLLSVTVSLDGPTPEAHDRSRGVPGSWRRAVRAIDFLMVRGVRVRVAHVVTPENRALVGALADQVATLGVDSLRVISVLPAGAATRGRSWDVDRRSLVRDVERARRRHSPRLEIRIEGEPVDRPLLRAPVSFVVRPNGAVMAGNLCPIRFGDAREAGLEQGWRRIRAEWERPRVSKRSTLRPGGRRPSPASLLMYRDDEADIDADVPAGVAATQQAGDGDLGAAAAHVRELVLARRYRLGDVRFTPADLGRRYVRLPRGEISLLNRTAAQVMDACAPGTGRAAVQALAASHPAAELATLETDTVRTVDGLVRRGVLVPG